MLRINAGSLKGFRLTVPATLRATEGKVRQAIYNILGDEILGMRVLDGYAGSGALGFEALSRGADFVAFVDSDPESILAIRDNLSRLGEEVSRDQWRVMQGELPQAFEALAAAEAPFNLVLLDPPYRTDDARNALQALTRYAILAPAGWVAVEHERRTELPASIGSLALQKRHRYGDTVLSFYSGS